MAYVRFSAYGAGSRERCTLRASGYLFIPKAMVMALSGVPPKSVVLLYDSEAMKLGVTPYDSLTDDSTEERQVSKEDSGIAVNIVPLLRAYRLEKPSKKIMLDAKVTTISPEDETPIVEVDMAPVVGVIRPRDSKSLL
jgi:hypothetical protein